MRALTLFCLLLVSAASSVQAVHIHGDWLPQHAAHVQTPADATQPPGGEEHCPLCVAMHSALPASAAVAVVSTATPAGKPATLSSRSPESPWHFAAFSRPPPTVRFL